MNQPLVSIFIITYNQARFVRETLLSALAQDYANTEIIVADDGSTDGTDTIIRELAQTYPAIVPLLDGPNLGITGNSNRALRACKGKYIAFMGGDDLLLPEKVSRQVEWLEADGNRALCGHHVEVFYDDGRPPHLHRKRLPRGKGPKCFIRHGTLFGATSVMVRASSAPHAGFDPSLKLVSDGMFFIETLMGGGEFGYVPGVYARYRQHADNITNQSDRCVNDLSQAYEILPARYPKYMRDARVGKANIIHYGRGLACMKRGETRPAIAQFCKGIAINPFGYKLWVRLIQAVLLSLRRSPLKSC